MALITDFTRIASSGETIDGRELKPQDIRDMAETYDPKVYTAQIYYNHWRWFGVLGEVVALKAEEYKAKASELLGDRTELYARIQPNARLVGLNKNEGGLFGSVELRPNIAGTGKTYLRGFGVTNEPASLCTERFEFSAEQKEHWFSATLPLELNFSEAPEEQNFWAKLDKKMASFFSRREDELTEPTDEDETLSKEQLDKLEQRFSAIEDKLNKFMGQGDDVTPPEQGTPEPGSVAELAQRFASFEEKFSQFMSQGGDEGDTSNEEDGDLEKRFSAMEEKLEKALSEAPGKANPKDNNFSADAPEQSEVFI